MLKITFTHSYKQAVKPCCPKHLCKTWESVAEVHAHFDLWMESCIAFFHHFMSTPECKKLIRGQLGVRLCIIRIYSPGPSGSNVFEYQFLVFWWSEVINIAGRYAHDCEKKAILVSRHFGFTISIIINRQQIGAESKEKIKKHFWNFVDITSQHIKY